MATLLLGRPLTFWDVEQIDYIKTREIQTVLYENKEWKKISESIDEKNREISSLENEIFDLETEIAELEEEQNALKNKIIEKNPILKNYL